MKNKILTIYHYFEKDHIYVKNFFHFLRFGYSPNVDYVVVIAGNYTISLPQLENLTYLFTENKNNDYGGYSIAVKKIANIADYDFVFFINSSVRGPYIPSYITENWTSFFIKHLSNEVGLVGVAINILPKQDSLSEFYKEKYGGEGHFSHIQSTAYGMHQKTLQHLIGIGFYDSNSCLSKDEVIRDYEIRLSQEIISAGWNIKCLLSEYNLIDYRQPHCDVNPTASKGDPCCSFAYFGRTPHPFELVFIKTNRSMFTECYLDRLSYSALVSSSASDSVRLNPSFAQYEQILSCATSSKAQIAFIPPKPKLRFIPKPLRPLLLGLGNLLNHLRH